MLSSVRATICAISAAKTIASRLQLRPDCLAFAASIQQAKYSQFIQSRFGFAQTFQLNHGFWRLLVIADLSSCYHSCLSRISDQIHKMNRLLCSEPCLVLITLPSFGEILSETGDVCPTSPDLKWPAFDTACMGTHKEIDKRRSVDVEWRHHEPCQILRHFVFQLIAVLFWRSQQMLFR